MINFILVILALIEIYIFFILKSVYSGSQYRIVFIIQLLVAIFTAFSLYFSFKSLGHGLAQTTKPVNLFLGFFVTLSVAKLVFISFMFFDEVIRLFQYLFSLLNTKSEVDYPSRRKAITNIGLGIAVIPFAFFLYGMFKTRYDFKVFNETLEFDDLPQEFDGITIAQFSDFHAGSLDDAEAINRGLDLLQSLSPDLILFTGDLVNNTSEEFDNFIPFLKSLSAPLGKFSVMGNHDYGLYYKWGSEKERDENEKRIRNHHKSIGFDLLENSHRKITKNNQTINLIGVENCGRDPFPKDKADLNKAVAGIAKDTVNILLSHDPHHWEDEIIEYSEKMHLTLSGHTHGMQMGIDLPGFKWSPVSLRYKNWAGLYEENGKFLYVNRGFGHIGFPGRVGIKPEITLIKLVKKKS